MQETPTLLSIPRWGQILGLNPLSLQQVDVASIMTSGTLCGQPTCQYAWQDNARTGREDIALAISTAEALIKEQLGYAVLPEWVSEEVNLHDQLWRPELYPYSYQAIRGMQRTQTLQGGYFIGGGQKATSVVSTGANIAYTDPNGDGYSERATVTVATTITDPNRVALFYPAASVPSGNAADADWEIRPINVTITGGVATIVFARELAVLPSLLTPLEPVAVDGTDNASFLTTVDVYRRYTDPTTSVRFEWEPGGWVGCCDTADCASCSLSVDVGCLVPFDDRNSIVRLNPATYSAEDGTWSGASWSFCRAPDRVVTWYRAGYRDKSRARSYYEMDRSLEQAVAYLSASLLERPLCGCNNVDAQMGQWRWDLASNISNDAGSQSWQVSPSDLDNPFGTRRGAVWAWKRIERRALGMAMAG